MLFGFLKKKRKKGIRQMKPIDLVRQHNVKTTLLTSHMSPFLKSVYLV
ncbi:MAG: hypothetical protein UZ08_BCD001000438 [Candidatus Parvibacillus calidus]|jgi:hypothetical protein|nr:MAG: hypothetical protein UZ08_BCD001000438 [Candidatus Parvibacillus calidus]